MARAGAAVSNVSAWNYWQCWRLSCNSSCSKLDAQGCVFHISLNLSLSASRKQVPKSIAIIATAITSHGCFHVTMPLLDVTSLLLMVRHQDAD